MNQKKKVEKILESAVTDDLSMYVDLVKQLKNVITSYSIHYTKLYELQYYLKNIGMN